MQTAHGLKSIRFRFMSTQILSILLTLVLLGAFCLFIFTDFYQGLQREKLEAHARSQAVEAGQIISKLSSDLERIKLFDFHLTATADPVLQEFRSYSTSFPKIVYLDRSGEVALSFLAGRNPVAGLPQGAHQAYQQALEQPNSVLVTIADLDPDFNAPVLVFTQARTGKKNGKLQGVLQATVPLSEFTRRFSDRYVQHVIKLVLIDSQGQLLLHPQSRLLRPVFSASGQLQEIAAQQGLDAVGFSQGLIDGESSYYAFAAVPGTEWTALAILQQSYFKQLLNRLIVYCLLLGLFGLLLGVLLAHYMARTILENIQRIKLQTQNLAEGKLDQRLQLQSGDELEDLATAVNSLTERLLQTSQMRDSLNLMLRTVIDPLVVTDSTGWILKTNPAAEALFGVAEAELVGRNLSSLFVATSAFATAEELQQHFSQGDFNNYETEVCVDGDLAIPVLFSCALSDPIDPERFSVSVFKDISEQKRAEQKITRLAYYDALTGLPNRILLRNRLEKTLMMAEREFRDGFHFGLMFLDLDHFKLVNDTLGHSVGDQLLQAAAERLRDCLRRSDTIGRPEGDDLAADEQEQLLARLGGDEFIVLLPKLRSTEDAAFVARRLIKDMSRPFVLGSHEMVTPASIGIALYPEDGRDADTLLRHADIAMYHAKQQGRNSFHFYSEEMNRSARERLFLENHLRSDIEHQRGFRLVYQPKVDMQTGQVCGMEALVRWEQDELGTISPVRFIPIAEETGLIVPLGRWILHTSCAQLKSWQDSGAPPMKIAVNLSGRQLQQPDLLPMIAEVLHETGLEPECLELELTESMLMETVENTIQLLQQLKDLGVTLAIDDFGTGYSSLSYLTRFPIDTLKIDRSFVRDLEADRNDATIVEAIVAMAHSLGLQVVAEGVESEFQQQFLKYRGCDQYQGFLFSKPVYAEEFEERFL
ncbi:MAG TPA: EAL domain-containing protein [Malonomonas sp.]